MPSEYDDFQVLIEEIKKIKQTKEEIFNNPKVKEIMADKNLQYKTLLSKYTILENSLG